MIDFEFHQSAWKPITDLVGFDIKRVASNKLQARKCIFNIDKLFLCSGDCVECQESGWSASQLKYKYKFKYKYKMYGDIRSSGFRARKSKLASDFLDEDPNQAIS